MMSKKVNFDRQSWRGGSWNQLVFVRSGTNRCSTYVLHL